MYANGLNINSCRVIDEGAFRFDELKKHIDRCKAPAVISIGEDTT